ncbi:MAG: DNA polymerase III subunit alpha, partial [Deltaproteobacteria bacterium]|nr:DNA polymerase III subunit alpha [Deltaproteobacteria bacterium]
VLPPDVNKSDIRWKGQKASMRVGLLSIKHLAAGTKERIVEKRRGKPYRDISDFCKRVRPDDREARVLIHAGAFDSLYQKKDRAGLLWELAVWKKSQANQNRSIDMFGSFTDSNMIKPSFPPQKECRRLRQEFEALGFLCDRHPMVLYAGDLKRRGIIKAMDLPNFAGRHIRIAGILITGKVVHTKHGDPMEFLTFEDETGLVETTFFPKAYRRFCAMLGKDRPFILYGKVEEDFGAHTLTVEHVDTFTDNRNDDSSFPPFSLSRAIGTKG